METATATTQPKSSINMEKRRVMGPKLRVRVPMKKKPTDASPKQVRKNFRNNSMPDGTSMESLLNMLGDVEEVNDECSEADQRSLKSRQSQVSQVSKRSQKSQRSRNRFHTSSASSVDSQSVGSLSLSECLSSVRQHRSKHRRNRKGSDDRDNSKQDSFDEMPSLASYGPDSTFTMPSFGSSIESSFTISSTDLSLYSETTNQKDMPDSSASPVKSPTRQAKKKEKAQERQGQQNLPTEMPIKVMRIPKKERDTGGNKAIRRSLLKSSAKNYKPDVIPLRESRWQTESSPFLKSSATNCDTSARSAANIGLPVPAQKPTPCTRGVDGSSPAATTRHQR